jgi:hypothetical protein
VTGFLFLYMTAGRHKNGLKFDEEDDSSAGHRDHHRSKKRSLGLGPYEEIRTLGAGLEKFL